MSDAIPVIIAVVAVGVAIIVAIVGAAWKLSARLSVADRRMNEIVLGVRSLHQHIVVILGLVVTAFGLLHRGDLATDQEDHDFVGQIVQSFSQGTESVIDDLSANLNPLTTLEAERLRYLVDKARRGELFTRDEIIEYDKVIQKARAERPQDPSIWPLVALGAFLLGLLLGKQRDSEP